MNTSMRKTKKDFSLGVQPAPDDSGVGLGTLKREHKAISFNEQDLEAGFEAPEPTGPDSLLGFKLKRRTRVNVYACNPTQLQAQAFCTVTFRAHVADKPSKTGFSP